MSPPQARSLTASAIESLRRGDAASARRGFEQVIAAGLADATVQLGLAYACTSLRDSPAALAAVDAALLLAPGDLRALMLKADFLDAAGDAAAAASFYQAVVRGVPPDATLPPELQQQVVRAQAKCDHYAQQFEATLRDHLAPKGPLSARVEMSLDIALGRKKIYLQEPLRYYFPGLPQIQFFERASFPWLDKVEAATAEIREELLAVLGQPSAFTPYVQADPSRPTLTQGGMLDNPDWSAFFLWRNGEVVADHAARCPRTMAALADVPMTRMPARSPSILFSQLRPGAHIPPHHGFINTRLIVHLPLIVPPGCTFRVGSETREWVEGRAWVFDDTIEHEAWNPSAQTRVILLFEVWRPELTEVEREQVTAMFEAISRHGSGSGDWGI